MFHWSGQKRTEVIYQSTAAECGLACVGMIANSHGLQIDLASLRRTYEISLKGATAADLINIGSKLNLASRAVRCEPEDIKHLRLPAILHWNLDHFVVVENYQKSVFTILDPSHGQRSVSAESLSKSFTGVAIEMFPNTDFQARDEKSAVSLGSLFRFDKTIIKPILHALALTVFLQLFVMAAPFFSQLIIDEAVSKGEISLVLSIAIGFSVLKILEIVTSTMRRIVFQLISYVVLFDLKAGIFHHLLQLPLSYFRSRNLGDIQQRFLSLQTINQFVTNQLIEAIIDGILALFIGYILFLYSWKLTLVVIGFTAFYAFVRFFFLRLLSQLETDQEMTHAQEANQFLETLRAIQAIKISAIETIREVAWRNIATNAVNADIKVGNTKIAYTSVNEATVGFSQIIVVGLAAVAVINESMSIGMMTAFLAYKAQFEQRLIGLLDKWAEYKLLNVHLERVADIALTQPEKNINTGSQLKEYKGSLQLVDIGFKYSPADDFIFQKINLTISPGEFVAVTGPSGHGKSSLLALMVNLQEPTEGQVLFDGRPVSQFGIKSIRQQVGIIMQDDTLLAGTIADNISMFDHQPDEKRRAWAASIAQIHDTIVTMPMAYQTLVGDMGVALSAGQKQRILIARALYRKPKLLILDEVTSHLDVATEIKINDALKKLRITRIAAAHRPDTLRKADRIIKLENGKLSTVNIRHR